MRISLPLLALILTACPTVVRLNIPDAATDAAIDDTPTPDRALPDAPPDAGRVCVPGSQRCLSATAAQVCDGDGAWSPATACIAGWRCQEGRCLCTPRCTGRACGPDGCGGQCGRCPPDATCDAAGRCVSAADRCEGDVARLCYGGPDGTLGRGLCRRGLQRCANGTWGACMGDVRPEPDTCDDGVDTDCDGETSEDCPLTDLCRPRPLGSATGERVATGTTLGAGRNLRGSCGGATAEDVAFAWTAPEAGEYTFSTTGSRFDTLLYVRDGCGGAELACNDDAADDVTGARVTVSLRMGQSVVVVVDGFDQSSGDFELHVTRGAPVACTPGATRPCAGTAMAADVGRCRRGVQTCAPSGVWGDACAGEVAPLATERCGDGVDDTCDGRADEGCETVATRRWTGRVSRVRRVPSPERDRYVSAADAPAAGVTLSVYRGARVIARTSADESGGFTLDVPVSVTGADRVVVEAGAADARGAWRFAVARDPGRTEPELVPFRSPVRPEVWSAAWPLADVVTTGSLRVADEGAARAFELFDDTRAIVTLTERAYGRSAAPVLVWYWPGASWLCGSCFGARSVDTLGQHFGAQLALLGTSDSEHVWGRTVITHELGHWAMSTFGTSPREGGTHYLGVLSPPGLAWSEGWATWFGSAVRGDPLHVITTRGTTFWFDLGARMSSSSGLGVVWPRPSASQGVLQWMDENEVSAILWSTSRALTTAPLYTALASRRMNASPFARGYRNPLGNNVPVLPDFLDALVCGGASRAAVQSAVGPYPYDTATPSCGYEAPVRLAWTRRDGRDVARVTCHAPLAAPLTMTVRRGPEVLWSELLRCSAGDVYERDVGDAAGATLTVDLRRLDFGVHAELRCEGAAVVLRDARSLHPGSSTGHTTLPTLNASRTLPTPLLNVRRMRIVYEPVSGATKSTSWKVSPVSVDVRTNEPRRTSRVISMLGRLLAAT